MTVFYRLDFLPVTHATDQSTEGWLFSTIIVNTIFLSGTFSLSVNFIILLFVIKWLIITTTITTVRLQPYCVCAKLTDSFSVLIDCSKLESQKLVDHFRSENEALHLEVDFSSHFVARILTNTDDFWNS